MPKSATRKSRIRRGEALDLEVNASSDYPRSPVIVADDLKRAGINAKPVLTPDALDTDVSTVPAIQA